MSNVMITPNKLAGSVQIPASKSDCHRAIICASLSGGICELSPVTMSKDIEATVSCVKAMGVYSELKGDTLTIDSRHLFSDSQITLDCIESGSTMRFLIPVAAALNMKAEFVGQGRLPHRPIGIYLDSLPKNGVTCRTEGGLPLKISGQLKSGVFEIPGNVSSQFVTGLLLALPLLDGDSKIILTSKMESIGYVNMTIDTMSRFGVEVQTADYGYFVKGNQRYTPQNYTVQGDWSQAAFFIASGALNGNLTVKGLDNGSIQGDREVCFLAKQFGADITQGENSVAVKTSALSGIEIDAGQIPDLVPALAVIAAGAKGDTEIYNAERLRIKESDRIKTTVGLVNSLGGKSEETADGLIVHGTGRMSGGTVDGCNDHRIVMAAAAASVICDSPVIITGAQAVSKSYPNFFDDFNLLGGKAVWLHQ